MPPTTTTPTTTTPTAPTNKEAFDGWKEALAGQMGHLAEQAKMAGYWIDKAGESLKAAEDLPTDTPEGREAWKKTDEDVMEVISYVRLWEGQRRILNRALREFQEQLDAISELIHQHEMSLCARRAEGDDDSRERAAEKGAPPPATDRPKTPRFHVVPRVTKEEPQAVS